MRSLSRSRRARVARRLRARRGFTIIEALVAIVMLTAGALALVGSSAVVIRTMNLGQRQARAANLASARIERLRAFNTCAEMVSGSATYGTNMSESWTTAANPGQNNGTTSREVTHTVRFWGRTKVDSVRTITYLPCTS